MSDQNYYSTFLRVAEDSTAITGTVPAAKPDKATVAALQYRLITERPYGRTQEDVLFDVFVLRRQIPAHALVEERERFFSKGQPCLRTSPLPKTYGWGLHFREDGKLMLYGIDTVEYAMHANDPSLRQLKALRSSR